jgi:hypothetical protein
LLIESDKTISGLSPSEAKIKFLTLPFTPFEISTILYNGCPEI